MRHLVLILGLSLSLSSFSQNSDLELLKKAYDEGNPMKSLELIRQIRAPENFEDSLRSTYLLTIGIAQGKLGREDSAFFYLNQCLEYTDFEFIVVRAGNAKGLVSFQSGNYQEAIQQYQEALTLAEQNNFQEWEATILGNMGGVYFQMDDYVSAIKYSKKSLEIASLLEDTDDISYGHLRLAVAYEEIDSLEKSIYHNKQSSKYAESAENYVLLTYIEKTLGNIHKKLGRLDSSLYHHLRAREFAELEGEKENIASTTNEIARVYFEKGDLKNAEKEATYVLAFSQENGHPHQIKRAHDIMYQIALRKRNFENALNQRNQYVIINDSLNAVETKERIAELEIQYETAKKEKEIIEANAEIERKDRFQAFLFIVIGIVVVFSFIAILLVIQRFRLRRALLSQEIDTLRAQINSIFGGGIKNLDLTLEQINDGLHKPLSEREYEILSHAISDQTNSEIAETVFVSVNTVKTHLKNVYMKLGVSNRKEALEVLLAKA